MVAIWASVRIDRRLTKNAIDMRFVSVCAQSGGLLKPQLDAQPSHPMAQVHATTREFAAGWMYRDVSRKPQLMRAGKRPR
jgi:hypothetical protein